MNGTIVWLHADNLNPHCAALQAAPGCPAVFVWDDELLEEWKISLKRIVFIYECLLELPVSIRRGDVAAEVAAFAQAHSAQRILTMASPSPRHRLICQRIMQRMPKGSRLEVLRDPAFVETNARLDLKRFSRYWSAVKYDVLRGKK
ncbi:MAG: hypothetical protein SNJ54_04000 [Anaerolineae bacterium]